MPHFGPGLYDLEIPLIIPVLGFNPSGWSQVLAFNTPPVLTLEA